jgi:prefoldin subunit 5
MPAPTPFGAPFAPTYSKEQEKQMLEQQLEFLEAQVESIRKRLEELSK